MEDILDFLRFMFPIFLVVLVVAFLLIGLTVMFNYNTCHTYAGMGIEVQFHFWGGCFAHHPTFGWVPASEYFKILNVNIP